MVWGNLPEDVANSGTASVFFLRTAAEMVPVYESKVEADKDMANHVEYGILNGNALGMLERILTLYQGADSVDDERLTPEATSEIKPISSKSSTSTWKRRSLDKDTAPVKQLAKPSMAMELEHAKQKVQPTGKGRGGRGKIKEREEEAGMVKDRSRKGE
ncbi:dynein heavy chain 10, axonemal [Plakobranchus ocellatus]|uniref:Dynein heavy chain 10, axonemal n=1 Tax=Plakobranchus ocellatus TaxID=259542 RepID=A0AAV4AK63_9GAST|nr:dynein heavy chain 10, axonemal [Plakobranchus ocellatus]